MIKVKLIKNVLLLIALVFILFTKTVFAENQDFKYENSLKNVSINYDNINRISVKKFGETSINYYYDTVYQGTLAKISFDVSNYYEYEYDDKLRVTKETKIIDNIRFQKANYYDSMNRVTRQVFTLGQTVDYVYNNQGGLSSLPGFVTNTNFDAFGFVLNRNYANNLNTQYTYNSKNERLTQIKTGNKQQLDYSYDVAGNVMGINDTINNKNYKMEYDFLNRLIKTTINNDVYQYFYNSIGNIMKIIKPGYNVELVYGNMPVHAPSQIKLNVTGPIPDSVPPTASIAISTKTVKVNESVNVTVTGADDRNLSAIWWFGVNTSDTELNKNHWYNCSGTGATNKWIVSTASLQPGTYTLGANARDAAGNQGNVVAYDSFTVTSVSIPVCGFQGIASDKDTSIKLPSVNINFTNENNTFTKNVTTNVNGSYIINLSQSRYVVTAKLDGYENYTTYPGYSVCTCNGYDVANIELKKVNQTQLPTRETYVFGVNSSVKLFYNNTDTYPSVNNLGGNELTSTEYYYVSKIDNAKLSVKSNYGSIRIQVQLRNGTSQANAEVRSIARYPYYNGQATYYIWNYLNSSWEVASETFQYSTNVNKETFMSKNVSQSNGYMSASGILNAMIFCNTPWDQWFFLDYGNITIKY